ncbi:unnamed protein product [Caenorhabditis bovis]|uniref:Uncharacterized protein n=1 Tax=Caenorhabditis bovis TaxID=2654633 RepID=A0A8S1FFT8_9PELO|nr:unnamed protein product [Caenorhabditis bovis]
MQQEQILLFGNTTQVFQNGVASIHQQNNILARLMENCSLNQCNHHQCTMVMEESNRIFYRMELDHDENKRKVVPLPEEYLRIMARAQAMAENRDENLANGEGNSSEHKRAEKEAVANGNEGSVAEGVEAEERGGVSGMGLENDDKNDLN